MPKINVKELIEQTVPEFNDKIDSLLREKRDLEDRKWQNYQDRMAYLRDVAERVSNALGVHPGDEVVSNFYGCDLRIEKIVSTSDDVFWTLPDTHVPRIVFLGVKIYRRSRAGISYGKKLLELKALEYGETWERIDGAG